MSRFRRGADQPRRAVRFLTPALPVVPGSAPGNAIHEAFAVNGSRAQQVVIGQVGALVSLILGSGLAIALLLDGHLGWSDAGGLLLVAMAAGACLGLRRGSVPLPVMDGITVATEVALAGAGIGSDGALGVVLPAIYVSIGTSVCLIRPMRGAILHMGAFCVSYGAVVVFGPPVVDPLTHWLAVVASIVVSATFVRWLVRRVVELARAEHQARLRLDETTAALAVEDELRNEFLAKMSHELRTPLNAIVGFADLLHLEVRDSLEPDQVDLLVDIADSGRDLLQLVDDLLDLRQVGEGALPVRPVRVDLCEIAQSVERLIALRAAAAGVTVRVRCTPRSILVEADPLRLRQILWNLIGNAVKYSPRGEVVDVVVAGGPDWADVTVTDRGPGIAPGDEERIFELYAQGDQPEPGSGIGLALCRRLSEAHGGTLTAAAGGGRGSAFHLRLPTTVPDDRRSADVDDEHPDPAPLSDLDLAILIPGSRANRVAIANVGRQFARAVAVLLPLFALVTPGPVAARIGVGALGLISLAVAGAMQVLTARSDGGFSAPVADAWSLGGFVVIAASAAALDPVHDIVALSIGWPVLSAAALASNRRLAVQVVAALVSYGIALTVIRPPLATQHWVAVGMIVATNAIVVRWVANRLRDSVVGLFEARIDAESAQQRVAAVSAHKRDFVASTSHELLTPLNAVLGASLFLRDSESQVLSDRHRAYLDDIHESGRNLLTLLVDLLDLAKVQDGRTQRSPVVCDPSGVLDAALRRAAPLAEERSIALTLGGRELPEVLVDPVHLDRILEILLLNALKYTAPGGQVVLSGQRAGDELVISVADTGLGISPDQQARVFEPFHQGLRRPPHADGGSGLGLALAAGLAAVEGAVLDLESEPERGSTFHVRLPLDAARHAS